MAISDRPALVDTNVLVYALLPEADEHAASRGLLKVPSTALWPSVWHRRCSLSSTQWSPIHGASQRLASRPRPSMPSAVPCHARPVPPARPCRRGHAMGGTRGSHPVTRGRVFDCQLAATMLGNGVTHIYTYNRLDFQIIEGIEVLTPQAEM